MLLRFLLDENLRHAALVAALEAARSTAKPIDFLRVGDHAAPDMATSDEALLIWAASEQRIIVSLDAASIERALKALVSAGGSSPGVILLRHGLSATDIVALLELVAYDTEAEEWKDACRWLP
jgi:hypothetical protein